MTIAEIKVALSAIMVNVNACADLICNFKDTAAGIVANLELKRQQVADIISAPTDASLIGQIVREGLIGDTRFGAAEWSTSANVSNTYLHMEMPFTANSGTIFLVEVRGFSASNSGIKGWASGYAFSASDAIVWQQNSDNMHTYSGSNGKTYVRYGPFSSYYAKIELDIMLRNKPPIDKDSVTFTLDATLEI